MKSKFSLVIAYALGGVILIPLASFCPKRMYGQSAIVWGVMAWTDWKGDEVPTQVEVNDNLNICKHIFILLYS